MERTKMTAFLDAAPKLILTLKADALPVWGTMTAQHMVEHLSSALIMSLKNTIYQTPVDQEIIQKHKTHMLSNGFKPGMSTGDGKLKDLKNPSLAVAIDQFTLNLNAFFEAISIRDLQTFHFYFGPLKNEEWLAFQYWHIQYHFKQFDIL